MTVDRDFFSQFREFGIAAYRALGEIISRIRGMSIKSSTPLPITDSAAHPIIRKKAGLARAT